MKRLLLAVLAATLLPVSAGAAGYAKIAVPLQIVKNNGNSQDPDGYRHLSAQSARNTQMVLDVFRRLGISFDIIPAGNIKTEQARIGYMQTVPGGQFYQYDGVAVPCYAFGATRVAYGTAGVAPSFRPDSLSRIVLGGWEVPALMIGDNVAQFAHPNLVEGGTPGVGCIADSCGMTQDFVNNSSKTYCGDQFAVAYSDSSIAFSTSPYNNGWKTNPASTAGGLRTLLGKAITALDYNLLRNYPDSLHPGARNTWNVDSIVYAKSNPLDSTVVWQRLWDIATLPRAKTVTYCDWMGTGGVADSIADDANVTKPLSEGSFATLLYTLAVYDSSVYAETGKRVIQRPLQFAVIVEGALSRGMREGDRGFLTSDTTIAYDSFDKMAANNIPVTFAVNPESAAAYPRDVQKLLANRAARFTPQIWDGVDGAAGHPGISAAMHARDVFGRKSPRAIAGDSSFTRWTQRGSGADTSLVMMLRYAQARQDSVFGVDRRCMVLVPPADDYSPRGATQTTIDSLFWAVTRLGYKGFVVDGQRYAANIYGAGPRAEGDTIGWYNRQGYYPVKDMTGGYSGKIALLAHNGYSLRGGTHQFWAYDDSSFTYAYAGEIGREVARAWQGFCGTDYIRDHDVWQYNQLDNGNRYLDVRGIYVRNEDVMPDAQSPRKGYIVRINASSLSGDPADPARAGLWEIRSLWRATQAINKAAGRTIIEMTYPDRIDPR